jgi:hypothetical protein
MMYDTNDSKARFRMAGHFIVTRLVFAFIIAAAVMILWNLLMPSLIHVSLITYWQALGLLALTRLLTGRVGGQGWRGRGAWHSKWSKMSDEEREVFKDRWKGRR